VTVPIFGYIKLAAVQGNLNDGIVASFNVYVAQGSFTFHLKNKNELWVDVDVTSIVGNFNNDYFILKLP
jgi:hypothetical protein